MYVYIHIYIYMYIYIYAHISKQKVECPEIPMCFTKKCGFQVPNTSRIP